MEVIASYMIDSLHLSRQKGTVIAALILLVCGIAPSMSARVLDNMDNFFGSYVLPTIVTLQVFAIAYRFGGERLRTSVINVFGNGYLGRIWVSIYRYLVPAVNIFLMLWLAHSNSAAPDAPWFMGWGGLIFAWAVSAIVVGGTWYYDQKHGYKWDGMKKEAV